MVEPQVAALDGRADRLRPLTELAGLVAVSDAPDDVVEMAAEAARRALDAASLTVGRLLPGTGVLRIVSNVGRLGPGELRRPLDDTYSAVDHPRGAALFAGEEGVGFVTDARQADADPAEVALLRTLGKAFSLEVPVVLEGRTWGILWASRDAEQPPFDDEDLKLAFEVAHRVAATVAQAEHLAKVSRLAYEDGLTGLANRRAADERLERALLRHRTQGVPVSLVVCDVNGLKRVNDEQGHDAGDALLIDVAGALVVAASTVDGCLAARLGGDEFCVVLDGHGLDIAVDIARRICHLTSRLGGEARVSCGVAGTDGALPAESPAKLLRLADAAQYRAKRSRAKHPVVAGRDPVPVSPLTRDAGERRELRGVRHPDRGRFLDAGLRILDDHRGEPARARLEAVAAHAAALLDAGGWSLSLLVPDDTELTTVSAGVERGHYDIPWDAHGDTHGDNHWGTESGRRPVIGSRVPIDRYPLGAQALAGGGFVLSRGAVPTDPDERAILAGTGFAGLLAAGGTNADGGWLVEIFGDELAAPMDAMAPTLRALVAVALTG